MQYASSNQTLAALDAVASVGDGLKMRLVEPAAIHDAVEHLRRHGLEAEEIELCLVRYFHVDLDLLNEALVVH